MNEANYFAAIDALNEHLEEVRPIFDLFCAGNGFVVVPRLAIGRYPRIRIERDYLISLYFDLWMDFDANGRRFERFRHDLPYSLYAGASIIETDGSKYGIRFQNDITCFSGRPFDQIGAVLQNEMQKYLTTLEKWDVQYLKDHGKKVRLGS